MQQRRPVGSGAAQLRAALSERAECAPAVVTDAVDQFRHVDLVGSGGGREQNARNLMEENKLKLEI